MLRLYRLIRNFWILKIELIKRRENDLQKVRREYEESVIKYEADLAAVKKRHQDSLGELVEQVENLTRVKNKLEKESSQLQMELLDANSQLEEITKAKVKIEGCLRVAEEHVVDYRNKIEENALVINELSVLKTKLLNENSEYLQLLEDAESKVINYFWSMYK